VVLLIDSEMYGAASLREDIFSTKQCKDLASKAIDVAAQEKLEEELEREAEAKQVKEEEARKKAERDAEIRNNWSMVGNIVVIQKLTSEKGKVLNESSGRVMNYSVDKDRFEVQCIESKERVFLKKDNLSVKYFGTLPISLPPNSNSDPKQPQAVQPKAKSQEPLAPAAWNCDRCTFENDEASAECSMCSSARRKTTTPVKEPKKPEADYDKDTVESSSSASNDGNADKITTVKKTIYVVSALSKMLTGKKGRKKNQLVEKSGASIQITTSASNKHVPVHLSGNQTAVAKAISLIEEAIGAKNVCGKMPKPQQSPVPSPAPVVEALEDVLIAEQKQHNPMTEHTFDLPGNAVETRAPPGLPPQLPSEIGIRNVTISSGADGSVSSINDRSHASRTISQQNFSLPENDSLLKCLREQQACIKGSAEEFFMWLVKSEDIDTIAALKEAVSDEDYLAESMKNGNGVCGVKGFKRKAFQRAVMDYREIGATTPIVSGPYDDLSSVAVSNGASVIRGMESTAFLPSFLFHDDNDASLKPISDHGDDIPDELMCPITTELLEDPVLAADGITYERSAIEDWFCTQMAIIRIAEEQLRVNPGLRRELEIVRRGITSPMRGITLPNLQLTPNTNLKIMTRAHKEKMNSISPNTSRFTFGQSNGY